MLEHLKELFRLINHIIFWIYTEVRSHVSMSSLDLLVIAIVKLKLLAFFIQNLFE